MINRLLNYIIVIIWGYTLAVVVSTLVALAISALIYPYTFNTHLDIVDRFLIKNPVFVIYPLMVTAVYALPGWLLCVIAAEYKVERRKFWFGSAGAFTAGLAIVIMRVFPESDGSFVSEIINPEIFFCVLPAGFLGGWAYWSVAGKHCGSWRQNSVQKM